MSQRLPLDITRPISRAAAATLLAEEIVEKLPERVGFPLTALKVVIAEIVVRHLAAYDQRA